MTRTEILDKIFTHKLMAILRILESQKVQPAAKAIMEAGIEVLEITLNSTNALEHIKQLRKTSPIHVLIGAGTVISSKDAANAAESGAQFIVTPIFKSEIIKTAHSYGIPVFMGAMTPTEILSAWEAGADVIKVFPASAMGIGYFKAVKGPLDKIPLMPTGGVNIENAEEWLSLGAVALGLGSSLVHKEDLRLEAYDKVKMKAKAFLTQVHG
ncbi:MAG: bifunctional 4-hydroxy-2-oxoglutarate aldolase/2-dehydro-3-deoxy-phosphogluconate aldolase [Bacteroidota bacterium]